MRLFLILVLNAMPLTAQLFTYGVKIGAPLSDPSGNLSTSLSYAVGPSVEFALPNHFALEASGILHHFRNSSQIEVQSDPGTTSTVTRSVRGNSWEFPLLAKRYFPTSSKRITPYAGAGVAFRTIGYQFEGIRASILSGTNLVPVSTPLEPVQARSGLGAGAAFEAGFRTRIGRIALLPEIRYTRWGDQRTGQNQDDVSMNLGFRF